MQPRVSLYICAKLHWNLCLPCKSMALSVMLVPLVSGKDRLSSHNGFKWHLIWTALLPDQLQQALEMHMYVVRMILGCNDKLKYTEMPSWTFYSQGTSN